MPSAIQVVREQLTYTAHGEYSFFKDLLSLRAPSGFVRANGYDVAGANERLRRHRIECDIESRAGGRKAQAEFDKRLREHGLEARVNPNSTLGTGGEFDAPAWLIAQYSTAARASRPLGDLVPSIPLPPGVSSVHVPRIVTGFAEGIQPQQGLVEAEGDASTVDASSTVVTIAGDGVVSQQLLDLSPVGFDAVIYKDLSEDYAAKLETQITFGTGAAGQLLGLYYVTGIATVTYTSGAPTLAALWPIVGQAFAQLSDARGLPPEVWLMRGARWAWIASSTDSSGRPIASPGNNSPSVTALDSAGRVNAVGPILGVPVYMDGAIPATVGAGLNQDLIIATRPSDHLLLESAPRFMIAPNPLSATLQVRLRLHRYVAWLGNRFPAATAVVTGTGLVVQSGF